MVWLIPAMMEGMASGSCTLNKSWRFVEPKVWAASTRSLGTCLMPRLVNRTAGGTAKITVAMTPGTVPIPKNIRAGIR